MTVRVAPLGNGLRVVSDTMPHVETASLGVWVGVGTRDEPAEANGIAHLLEHMAFKGTRRRNARQIAETIETVGGHLNAYTSREVTAYFAKVLKEDVALAVDLLADILQDSVFDPGELSREQEVVVQEIGQANDTPDDIVFDHFQETAFPDQPLGRPVLGTTETVRSVSRDGLFAYMGDRYRAPRMVLAAAGRMDHDALVDMAETAFTRLKQGNGPAPAPAEYRGGDFRAEKPLEQVHLLLGFPGVTFDDPDYYALSVYATLLGGGMSSRLFQEVREKRGLVYNIFSFASAYVDQGLFGVYAGTGEADVDSLVPVVCDEIMAVTQAVGDDEVARARAQLKASLLMALESTGSRCEQLGHQLLVYGRPLTMDEIVARVEAVDEAAIRRVAQRIVSGPLTVAAMGPIGRLEPYDRIAARFA